MLLMMNLLVVCNKLVSSFWLMLSYGFLALPPSKFAASLFGAVHCPFLTMRVGAYFASTSKTRGRTSSCSPTHKPIHLPQNSHHTYLPQHFHSCFEIYCHATSILHYMTLLSFIIYILLCMILYSWCAVYPCYARSLHILLHWQRHTVYIMF